MALWSLLEHPWLQAFVRSRYGLRCAAVALGVVGVYCTAAVARKLGKIHHYEKLRQRRRQEVKDEFTSLETSLQGYKDNGITKQSLAEIQKQLQSGQLKAIDVLRAFWDKALKLHRLTNCLVEPVLEAEDEARAFDSGNRQGLLAGIPVSLKDDISVKNYVTTTGASFHLGHYATEDSALVKVLRKQGAIVYVRTNEPQLGLSFEPGNPIYGRVMNPHNLKCNPGGSSSGEGALIGGGGSLLGFGSDIGGSIRVPAHNCGCCGFKPTSERVSHLGMKTLYVEESILPVSWGPLSRDVDGLVLAMRALWDGSMMHDVDALSPPMEFQNKIYENKEPMKIGYFYENEMFAATPVVRRAIDMAVKELRRQGHTVVEWSPPGLRSAEILEYQIILSDCTDMLQTLDGDKIDDSIKLFVMAMRSPWFVKYLVPPLARLFLTQQDADIAEAYKGCRTVYQYWQLHEKLKAYQHEVIREWREAGLDAVVSPVWPYPALPLGNFHIIVRVYQSTTAPVSSWYTPSSTWAASYPMLYNVLNFPAGTVRMTKQTRDDIKALKDYAIRDRFHKEVKQLLEEGEGLPVGVMVAALRWQDEKCLRVMKAVEKAADFVVS